MKRIILAFLILIITALACQSADQSLPPAPQNSVFDSGHTAYGFFPSPPKVSLLSVLQTYKNISKHGDFVLIQQNAAWEDFVNNVDGE